jgi:uncharacterized membrane protein YecN with MAPEG domain
MSNQPQNKDDIERQMAQRRKQNRIALLGIGTVLLILLAFSQVHNAWIYVLGTLVVVGILLGTRAWLERRYQAAAAREHQKQEDAGLGQDEPKK